MVKTLTSRLSRFSFVFSLPVPVLVLVLTQVTSIYLVLELVRYYYDSVPRSVDFRNQNETKINSVTVYPGTDLCTYRYHINI